MYKNEFTTRTSQIKGLIKVGDEIMKEDKKGKLQVYYVSEIKDDQETGSSTVYFSKDKQYNPDQVKAMSRLLSDIYTFKPQSIISLVMASLIRPFKRKPAQAAKAVQS